MKFRIENGFIEYCIKRKKRLFILIGLALLSTIALYMVGQASSYTIPAEGEGFVSIDLSEMPNKQINLEVTGELGEAALKRLVTIKHDEKKEDSESIVMPMSDSERLSLEVSQIVRDLNMGSGDVVELPLVSPDGVRLTWQAPKKGNEYLLPLLVPLIGMFYLYRGERDKKASEEKRERARIIRELPGFNNKLVLLMESGLIYEEALERICGESSSEGGIERIFSKAMDESKLMNGHPERLIGEYARERKISELSRLISIVTESRERGTDLRDKLASEGEILWEKRKRQAEEQGKLADTKLAMPLGMMLISLLLVTAAPAFMQF
ncbi:MAG: type II secretion system F family protein [Firmicutes bacterium]|nr:type II secretion system F family protein [Bacillota bacterium]